MMKSKRNISNDDDDDDTIEAMVIDDNVDIEMKSIDNDGDDDDEHNEYWNVENDDVDDNNHHFVDRSLRENDDDDQKRIFDDLLYCWMEWVSHDWISSHVLNRHTNGVFFGMIDETYCWWNLYHEWFSF